MRRSDFKEVNIESKGTEEKRGKIEPVKEKFRVKELGWVFRY